MEYRHKNSSTPKKIKSCLGGKSDVDHILGLWRHSQHRIIQKQQHVNSAHYVAILQKFSRNIAARLSGQTCNSPAQCLHMHTSEQTVAALECFTFDYILPHPSYNPNLAPCDFFPFPKLKEHLKGHHYLFDDEVLASVHTWLWEKT